MHYVQGHDAKAADIPALRQRNAYFRGMPSAMIGVVIAVRYIMAYKVEELCLMMAIRFDANYGAQAESEFERVLMPPLSTIDHRGVQDLLVPLFREAGHLEEPRPRVVSEVHSLSEYFDRTPQWGALSEDIVTFDGFAAFIVEARETACTKAWNILSQNPMIDVALKWYKISTPSSLDIAVSKGARKEEIRLFKDGDGFRRFKGDAGRSGTRFMLGFAVGPLRQNLLYALFQFLTAAKAIAEQAPHFRSLRPLQKAMLYLHVVLDGVLSIGAVLISFIIVSGVSSWHNFVEKLEHSVVDIVSSQNLVSLTKWDQDTFHERITMPMIREALPELKPLLKDLHTPSADSEAFRLTVFIVCLAISHGFSVLILGTAVHDLQAILITPVASLGKGGRTRAKSVLAMAGKVGLLVVVYVRVCLILNTWSGFKTAVAFAFNSRLPFLGYSCMLIVMLFLLLASGWIAAAALEAAGQQVADAHETESWGYQLAQWPPSQCACADLRKKRRRRGQEGTRESALQQLMTQPLVTSYGACASSAARRRGDRGRPPRAGATLVPCDRACAPLAPCWSGRRLRHEKDSPISACTEGVLA
ncbi:unnamed protein product, partial [Prorocentrum cordatum]